LTRKVEAPLLFESFFVSAVASLLGIRWFLAATGYPQVGSSGIHVAHMLWGGLLLLAAVLLLLGFLDSAVGHAAAVIAGLGFGTFIDEIGKFVTSDNDYFFQPSIALIYLVLVAAFLVARVLVGGRRVSGDEALANALGLMAGAPPRGLEPDDRARIQELIALADPADPRSSIASRYLAAIPAVPGHDGPLEVIRDRLATAYARVMAVPWADEALVVGVIAYAALAVVGVVVVVVSPAVAGGPDQAVSTAAQVGSTTLGAMLIGRGALALHGSRLAAYHWFQRGLLVWILVTQVFVFYSTQLGGLAGLGIDLVAYGSIRYAISQERAAARASRPGAAPSGAPDEE
jgi:uncharacterized membrane protein